MTAHRTATSAPSSDSPGIAANASVRTAITATDFGFDPVRFLADVNAAVARMHSASAALTATQIARLREFGPSFELLHTLEAALAERLSPRDVHEAGIASLIDVAGSQAARESPSIDRSTLEIVARIFDFIARDPALAAPIAEVILRLQIPVLRAALIDREFFVRDDQPARRFLDALYRDGVAWSPADGTEDPVFVSIASAVQRAIDTFHVDLAAFDQALAEFQAQIAADNMETEQHVGPTIARAAREEGYAAVEPEVDRRLARRFELAKIDDTMAAFLRGPWRNVLVELCAGRESAPEPWIQALNVTDALIWSVLPKDSSIERRELVRSLPGIVEQVAQFLDRIHWHGTDRDRFMQYLMARHAVVARTRRGTSALGTADESAAPVPSLDSNSAPVPDADRISVPQAMPGDWFVLDTGDVPALRCRLCWISPKGTRYVFARRDGNGAFVKSDVDLAKLLRTGALRKLDTSPLVARAIAAIVLTAG